MHNEGSLVLALTCPPMMKVMMSGTVNRYSKDGDHAFNIDDRLTAEPGGVLQHGAANDAVLLCEDALHGESSLPQNHKRSLPFGVDPLRATPH